MSGPESVREEAPDLNASKARTPRLVPEANAEGSTERADIVSSADDGIKKEESRWSAVFAQHGHCLYQLASGGYVLSRWGYTRELPDLRAVAALARQMGVRT